MKSSISISISIQDLFSHKEVTRTILIYIQDLFSDKELNDQHKQIDKTWNTMRIKSYAVSKSKAQDSLTGFFNSFDSLWIVAHSSLCNTSLVKNRFSLFSIKQEKAFLFQNSLLSLMLDMFNCVEGKERFKLIYNMNKFQWSSAFWQIQKILD